MMNCSKCKNKYKVFNRNMFMIQDRQHDDVFEKAPIFVSLQNGIDIRTGISIGIKLNLRAGITACYDREFPFYSVPFDEITFSIPNNVHSSLLSHHTTSR